MKLKVRRFLTFRDLKRFEAGKTHADPLCRIAAVAIVENPFAGSYVDDLTEAIDASMEVGAELGTLAVQTLSPFKAQSYGKGGIVGLGGELEHANAMLTTTFAAPVREAIGGAIAWIPSFTKMAVPGAAIDVPLAHKDALYVRSHYDGVTVTLPPDCPAADEVALIVCLANRSRLNARVGGLAADEIVGKDGLR